MSQLFMTQQMQQYLLSERKPNAPGSSEHAMLKKRTRSESTIFPSKRLSFSKGAFVMECYQVSIMSHFVCYSRAVKNGRHRSLKLLEFSPVLEISRPFLEEVGHPNPDTDPLVNSAQLAKEKAPIEVMRVGNVALHPLFFQPWHSLVELYLDDCPLLTIPSSIGALKRLERLEGINMFSLIGIHGDIGKCESLRSIELSNHKLTLIPRELRGMTQLKQLKLDVTCHSLEGYVYVTPDGKRHIITERPNIQHFKGLVFFTFVNNGCLTTQTRDEVDPMNPSAEPPVIVEINTEGSEEEQMSVRFDTPESSPSPPPPPQTAPVIVLPPPPVSDLVNYRPFARPGKGKTSLAPQPPSNALNEVIKKKSPTSRWLLLEEEEEEEEDNMEVEQEQQQSPVPPSLSLPSTPSPLPETDSNSNSSSDAVDAIIEDIIDPPRRRRHRSSKLAGQGYIQAFASDAEDSLPLPTEIEQPPTSTISTRRPATTPPVIKLRICPRANSKAIYRQIPLFPLRHLYFQDQLDMDELSVRPVDFRAEDKASVFSNKHALVAITIMNQAQFNIMTEHVPGHETQEEAEYRDWWIVVEFPSQISALPALRKRANGKSTPMITHVSSFKHPDDQIDFRMGTLCPQRSAVAYGPNFIDHLPSEIKIINQDRQTYKTRFWFDC